MFDYQTRQLIEQTLLVFAALFPVVNPIGGAPVFLAMTRGLGDAERRQLARRVALNAFLLVMGSFVVGSYVIDFFGLSVPVIQVGGGLIVCALAWRLLHSDEAEARLGPISGAELAARAFYPLTMPLTVGRARSRSRSRSARSYRAARPRGRSRSPPRHWARSCSRCRSFLLFRHSERLTRALGTVGTQVLLRLSAFILLCIGVQIVWSGVFALIGTIPSFRPR